MLSTGLSICHTLSRFNVFPSLTQLQRFKSEFSYCLRNSSPNKRAIRSNRFLASAWRDSSVLMGGGLIAICMHVFFQWIQFNANVLPMCNPHVQCCRHMKDTWKLVPAIKILTDSFLQWLFSFVCLIFQLRVTDCSRMCLKMNCLWW